MSHVRRSLLIRAGIWTLFGILMSVVSILYRTRAGLETDVVQLLFSDLSYVYLWFALTPLVLLLADRFRIGRPARARHLTFHLIFAVLLSGFHKAGHGLTLELYQLGSGGSFSAERLFQGVLAYLDYGILVYCVILLVRLASEYYRGMVASEVRTTLASADRA